MTDIRQKIVKYQWYFQGGGYKRYEDVFGASLRGFRLLFLAGTNDRLVALCKLAQELERRISHGSPSAAVPASGKYPASQRSTQAYIGP